MQRGCRRQLDGPVDVGREDLEALSDVAHTASERVGVPVTPLRRGSGHGLPVPPESGDSTALPTKTLSEVTETTFHFPSGGTDPKIGPTVGSRRRTFGRV